MQRTPLAREQIGLDGGAGQRMTESRYIRRLFDHELRVDELLDQPHQLRFAVTCQRLKQIEVEAPASDRCQPEHLARGRADLIEAALHGELHATWQPKLSERLGIPCIIGWRDVARRKQRLEGFLHKEGVALGYRVDCPNKGCIHGARQAEDCADLCIDIARSKARQTDLGA